MIGHSLGDFFGQKAACKHGWFLSASPKHGGEVINYNPLRPFLGPLNFVHTFSIRLDYFPTNGLVKPRLADDDRGLLDEGTGRRNFPRSRYARTSCYFR